MLREYRKYTSTCNENTECSSAHATRIPKVHQHMLREYRKYTNTCYWTAKGTPAHVMKKPKVHQHMLREYKEYCSLTSVKENMTTINSKQFNLIFVTMLHRFICYMFIYWLLKCLSKIVLNKNDDIYLVSTCSWKNLH
jgi:hypothetical protein